MDFRRHAAADLAAQVRAREVSARELVTAALERIDAHDATLRAFVALDPDRAIADAAALDARTAAGADPGPLAGLPLGVKDLEDAAGFPTRFGSAFHSDAAPATEDSILVGRLRAAGCVVVGKTATSEWGWAADTQTMINDAAVTPWDTGRTAGGSSGGSGAALAAGLVPICTGSDGGGSIRIPASIGGFSGFKASQGRVPNGGPRFPGSGLFSVKGPMTRTTADLVAALATCVGPHPTDMFSLPAPPAPWTTDDAAPPERVLWAPDWGFEVDPVVRATTTAAVEALAAAGTEVIEIDTVLADDPVFPWFTMWTVSMWRMHEDRWGTPDWERITPGLADQMRFARDHVSAADYARALDAAHAANLELAELFSRAPILLCPTTAGRPPAPGGVGTIDGREDLNWVRFTFPFNLTRHPAGTVCAGVGADGLPVGLQVVGPQHGDAEVLTTMAALEVVLGPPPIAPGFDTP